MGVAVDPGAPPVGVVEEAGGSGAQAGGAGGAWVSKLTQGSANEERPLK